LSKPRTFEAKILKSDAA